MHALAEQLVWLSLTTALCGPVRELVRGSIGKNWTAYLVQKFDAHTVQDLSELTEGDLENAGLTEEQRRRLRTALNDHMRFLPKGRTQIQIKRDQVLRTVLDEIHREGGAPSLSNVLAATGTGNWAPRFAALGVRAWDDLLLLTDDDFAELGMTVLHVRRTQALLSRIRNETRQFGLSTLRHDAYPAAMRPLPEDVGAMLRRMNLSIYAQALAGHGVQSIEQLARSSHATLSASGVKLVQRRQLLSFARHRCAACT
ncbi:hypothetical protein AB1Y20_014356 [Prymnesium parvum]|uniref:SAM domain-containing protein n=1 Tax=Prymnesium parvum TaxID=97485 RepID=A0AB34IG06_PRYPA